MSENQLELLSPVGNEESFYASIYNGADAIYLGLSLFNARAKSQFFNIDNIKKYVDIAHIYGVKVFITFNTLVKDNEFKELLPIIEKCIEYHIDAYIVQDLGLASLLINTFPNIELHASTQLGIHNLEGAKVAEEIGFKRIVLSREVSKEEILNISKNTNLEIEYFVQGALCVGFSGNCYISGMLYGKSGNRGKCKQLCRLQYSCKSLKNKYLLSAKDICMIDNLEELKNLGVKSLKVEGRIRREGYVAQTIATYRKVIDNNFKVSQNDKNALKKSFNRGDYTKAYLESNSNIIDYNINGHKGIKIGKVIKFEKGKKFNSIYIKSNHIINKNDGLKFIKNNEVKISIGVKAIKNQKGIYIIDTAKTVSVGDDVHLILDYNAEKSLLDTKKQKIIDVSFEGKINDYAYITVIINDKEYKISNKSLLEEAKTSSLDFKNIKTQIDKSNDFIKLNLVKADFDNVFIRKSELNELRRNAIEHIKTIILDNYNSKFNIEKSTYNYPVILNKDVNKPIIFIRDINHKEDIDNKILIISPKKYNIQEIIKFIDKFKGNKLFLDLPVYMTSKEFKDILKLVNEYGLGIVANNISHLYFKKFNVDIIAGAFLNVFNNYTVNFLNSKGILTIISSFELSLNEYNKLNNSYRLIYNELPLMFFQHCPSKNLFNHSCKNCKNETLEYIDNFNNKFTINKKVIRNCHFEFWHKISNDFEINSVNKIALF